MSTAPSAAELARLPRVGMRAGQEDRCRSRGHGPFGGLAGLDRVPGVGPGLLGRPRAPHLAFSRRTPASPGRRAVDNRRCQPTGSCRPSSGGGSAWTSTLPRRELDALPGIGPARAAAIVQYRERQRPVSVRCDELARVPGFGPAAVARLRDRRARSGAATRGSPVLPVPIITAVHLLRLRTTRSMATAAAGGRPARRNPPPRRPDHAGAARRRRSPEQKDEQAPAGLRPGQARARPGDGDHQGPGPAVPDAGGGSLPLRGRSQDRQAGPRRHGDEERGPPAQAGRPHAHRRDGRSDRPRRCSKTSSSSPGTTSSRSSPASTRCAT